VALKAVGVPASNSGYQITLLSVVSGVLLDMGAQRSAIAARCGVVYWVDTGVHRVGDRRSRFRSLRRFLLHGINDHATGAGSEQGFEEGYQRGVLAGRGGR
jgi:hypothetical protein